jgi:hypothetical protein
MARIALRSSQARSPGGALRHSTLDTVPIRGERILHTGPQSPGGLVNDPFNPTFLRISNVGNTVCVACRIK